MQPNNPSHIFIHCFFMKRFFFLLLTNISLFFVQAQDGFQQSATEIAACMGIGWNLGNTFEAGNNANNFTNKGGLEAETFWQPTKTTQEIIDYVKESGFSSIRIPCAWVMGHISNSSTYEIDAKWMARVKEVVDYCIKADLYVIINQHWDGGWLENNIKATGAAKNKNQEVLKAIWTQIAEAFKDYDEHLLFAGLNEPNADNQTETNALLEYEQIFINTVRATGGNNSLRMLIVQGPTTDIEKTEKYYNTLPTDPAGEGRLMMEVHYYNPWQFWGMEKDESWGNVFYYWGEGNHVAGSKHNPTWDCEEAAMERLLDQMKAKFVDKKIPVILGEFGANWRNISSQSGENQKKHDASIQLHYYTLTKMALERGMVPMMWDTNYCNRPSMTIIDRKNLKIYNSFMMDGIKQAVSAFTNDIPIIETTKQFSHLYDLQGHQIDPSKAQKGIYIKNGKKSIAL